MGDKLRQWEPLHTTNDWEVHFTLPEYLKESGVNPCVIKNGAVTTVNKLKSFDEVSKKRFIKKLNDDIQNISFEFNDRNDGNVYRWMQHWKKMIAENYKEETDSLLYFFEFDKHNTDPSAIDLHLKKPLNQLTDKEREDLRKLLTELFDISEEGLSKWGL